MESKFLDIGCKIGGSWNISSKFGFKPEEGIGIDINETHVQNAKNIGLNVRIGDATNLDFDDESFELVISNHVFEHLPSRNDFDKAIQEALRVSSRWVYIAFPIFDHDEYLKELGLKTFYSHWTGHTCMVHLSELLEIFKEYRTNLEMIKLLKDSNAKEIHPISSPIDQFEYNSDIHQPKPYFKFNREIYREFALTIHK
jgi:SAM-dependent methyltransferase